MPRGRNPALDRELLEVGAVFILLSIFRAGRHHVLSSGDGIKSVIKRLTCYVGFCVDKILSDIPWKSFCSVLSLCFSVYM